MRRTLALALVVALLPHAASARVRKHRDADDQPVTRAEVAVALEPALSAHTAANGRQYTGQDIGNLEKLAIESSDETVATEERVARLTAEIDQLRRDIQELRRMRHRRW